MQNKKRTNNEPRNTRGRKQNTPNDENIDPYDSLTSNRRSARLNAAPDFAAVTPETNDNDNGEQSQNKPNQPPTKRKHATAAGAKPRPQTSQRELLSKRTDDIRAARADDSNAVPGPPTDEDAQLHNPGLWKEIQDLQRQLREEKEKNRILNRSAVAQTSQTSKTIPKPKGSVGEVGFSLITAMKLDKQNQKDKALYNDILASVRALAIGAGIDLSRKYKDQSITKLSKLMLAAKEAEPYLARFEDDWATGQILRQYINGKRKYDAAKARGQAKIGKKRKHTSPTSPNKRIRLHPSGDEDEIDRVSSDGSNGYDYQAGGDGGEYEGDEDQWTGIGTCEGSYNDENLVLREDDGNSEDGSQTL